MSFENPEVANEENEDSKKEKVIESLKGYFTNYALTDENFFFEQALSQYLSETILENITISLEEDGQGQFVTERVFFNGEEVASSTHLRKEHDSNAEIKVNEDVVQKMIEASAPIEN